MATFVDLFCGIGGFRYALEKRGLECVFSSEIDEDAKEAYRKNFGERPEGDIKLISEKKIPKHDILCAGFPCQAFSVSGKKLAFGDDRGTLFYEIVRIAASSKPKALLLENVPNILSVASGETIKTIYRELEAIGYEVKAYLLNSSFFGIPQARKRVYFLCLRKDFFGENFAVGRPKETYEKFYLKDIAEKNPDPSLFIDRDDVFFNNKEISEPALKPLKIGSVNKGGQGERIYSLLGHSATLSAFGGGAGAKTGLYLTDKGVRRLSIGECKKLMGFPENHYLSSGVKGYRQLGNAVIPSMVGLVYDSLGKIDF